jgi:hypothetical protein
MPRKICLGVFSTNRPEYLSRALESQKHLDFTGCEVWKVLIDDMPLNRDDSKIIELAGWHDYEELWLHAENKGIGLTWEEFWGIVRPGNFDYVLMQEDDVEILEPVCVLDMIRILELRGDLSQVVLKRQPWYPGESPSEAFPTDMVYGNFRGETKAPYSSKFSSMCSLFHANMATLDLRGWLKEKCPDNPNTDKMNVNEGIFGNMLEEKYGLLSMHLKNKEGKNLINHIGEYTIGKRVLPWEFGYDNFARYDPALKYNSRNGERWPE